MKHAAATDIGTRRVNEDSFLTEPPLFAVADGMGGHSAGDVASKAAVEALRRAMGDREDGLLEAVKAANEEVFRQAVEDPSLSGMGTTITALLAKDKSVQIAHVGDSRAYLLRDRRLQRLTRDHSLPERLVREGKIRSEEADRHPQRSVLERALGVEASVDVDVKLIDTQPGDRFLLCTDGLTSVLLDDEIHELLQADSDPQRTAKKLVREAIEAGANDNVTVLVVDLPGGGGPGKGPPLREEKAAGAAAGGWASSSPGAASSEPGPAVVARRRGGGTRKIVVMAVVAATLAGGALVARASLASSWYVGDDSGRVAIFRGIPGSVAGIRLHSVARRTDIPIDALTGVYRQRLKEGLSADTRQEAEAIVRNLDQLRERPAPSPAPSPSPVPQTAPPGPPSPSPSR